MNSAKSFFPTRSPQPQPLSHAHRHKSYHLRKQFPQPSSSQTLDPQTHPNIFKSQHQCQIRQVERPVGGEELFKRMELERAEGKKLRRTSYFQRNAHTSISHNHKVGRVATEWSRPSRADKAEERQQLYKSHQSYDSGRVRGLVRSLQTIQAKFEPVRMERMEREVQEHFEKMGVLGEMERERPLVEQCGDSYFEMLLRNRFEEELKLPSFLYSLKDKPSHNKLIARLRNYKPNLLERRQLVLRGKKQQPQQQQQQQL